MQECRRTNQTCLFVYYPVSAMHIIICVSELVILFLITLANKEQETMFAQRFAEATIYRIFQIIFIHVLTLSFEINGRT